jgi:predicted PurR-regulated permease PerM
MNKTVPKTMPQPLFNKPPQPSWLASLIWLGLGVVAWLILKLLAPVLTPFVIALVLAYSLAPVVQMLQRTTRRRLPHWLLVAVVELGFITLALTLLLLIVPILGKELPLLQAQLPRLAERLNTALSPVLAGLGIPYSLDPASVKSFAVDYLQANASDIWTSVLPSLKLGGGVIFTLLGLIVLVPVVLFYLLSDWANMLRRVEGWIPRAKLPVVKSFINEADVVLGQYMRGQLLVMLILAVFYSAGLTLWGLDLALPIGVFTGLAMCIPYIGFGIGLILALLAGVLQFDLAHTALMLVTVYGTGQVLEGFFLTPRLVGERIGLHPLAVIFALLAFGQLFGFIGVLVALPASAVLLVALRRLKARYLASQLYQA